MQDYLAAILRFAEMLHGNFWYEISNYNQPFIPFEVFEGLMPGLINET